YLLVCDPPEQTAEDIARNVDASRASVSTMTRLLLHAGLVERQVQPGRRRDVFRIHAEAFRSQMTERIRLVTQFRKVLDRGLAALEGEPPARTERVREMHRMYSWFERELPRLIARFEKEVSSKQA